MSGPHYYDPAQVARDDRTLNVDVCIYGGTSAGVIAAVQLARLGRKCVILEPGGHLGGMTAGGLSYTDIGNKAAIGGLSRDFYRRCGKKYGVEEEWKFEPRIAEEIFNEWLRETGTPVFFHQFLHSVEKSAGKIAGVRFESMLAVRARMFIDATYEGDLMAKAGVHYFVGRESNSMYGETLNGAQVHASHQFERAVSPYIVEKDSTSGLLPGIGPDSPVIGAGDKRVQAYNFRLCLTREAANRIPFPKPEKYDASEFELLARYFAAGWENVFEKFDGIRGQKADMNNFGAVSTDFIGRNYDYPEADYAKREEIFQAHVNYQQGLLWFLGNDPRVPEKARAWFTAWGLAKDEFTATGGWPHQLYVREARRMVSDLVMTEKHCRGAETANDAVGLAAYNMDSHNCQRFVKDGTVRNEGDVQERVPPYAISYRSIRPKKIECENLLVPVCLASTHIAYGSIRMEPVFMILGQSAAIAASLALDRKYAVQDVARADLKSALEKAGQILAWTGPKSLSTQGH